MSKKFIACGIYMILASGLLMGQTAMTTQCSGSTKMGCLIPNVFGPDGLTLPNAFHQAHFDSDFQANFSPLNAAVATELTMLPVASPASGFLFSFDKAAGMYVRSAQSFGPTLAERADTIGKGRAFVGVTYQYFSFDKIDGVNLNNVPAVFKHLRNTGPPSNPDPAYENDFIATSNSLNLFVNQVTMFVTAGLTKRIDVSVAVPVLNVNLGVTSAATIHRTAPPDPVFGEAHYFNAQDPNSVNKTFSDSGYASGFGDVTLRFKGKVIGGERAALAIATDVRFPTGDALNFLGSGTYGVKPFVIGSIKVGRVTPHLNIGFQVNGDSILAGDVLTGRKGHLPNSFFYTVGTDIGLSRRVTLAFDLLGQRVFDATTVAYDQPYISAVPERVVPGVTIQSSYPQIAIQKGSFDIISGSGGCKVQLFNRLLLTANVLFQMNNDGLRAKAVPMGGLSFTF